MVSLVNSTKYLRKKNPCYLKVYMSFLLVYSIKLLRRWILLKTLPVASPWVGCILEREVLVLVRGPITLTLAFGVWQLPAPLISSDLKVVAKYLPFRVIPFKLPASPSHIMMPFLQS